MPANRILTSLALLMVSCSWGTALQSSPGKSATPPCKPGVSVLPDGTWVKQNVDCTVTRTPKTEIMKPPPEQTEEPENEPASDKAQPASASEKLRALKPAPPPPGLDDPALRAKYLQAMNGYFDYFTEGFAHRQQVFHWQLVSSKIIFFFVTLLVLSGIYFAALQFHAGLRHRPPTVSPSGEVVEPKIPDAAVTTFSASAKGIEVSSPVLGVIILVISLAFFYLYLVYVYPISELF